MTESSPPPPPGSTRKGPEDGERPRVGGLIERWHKWPLWAQVSSILGTVLIFLVVLLVVVGNPGETDSRSAVDDTPPATVTVTRVETEVVPEVTVTVEANPTPAPGAPAPQDPPTLADDGWKVETGSIRISGDVLGQFHGTMRVTNTSGSTVTSAIFTLTVFSQGNQVATMTGAAASVGSGETNTVQLLSMDAFVEGPYEFDFQTDLSM